MLRWIVAESTIKRGLLNGITRRLVKKNPPRVVCVVLPSDASTSRPSFEPSIMDKNCWQIRKLVMLMFV
jgi:hypothetical protein